LIVSCRNIEPDAFILLLVVVIGIIDTAICNAVAVVVGLFIKLLELLLLA